MLACARLIPAATVDRADLPLYADRLLRSDVLVGVQICRFGGTSRQTLTIETGPRTSSFGRAAHLEGSPRSVRDEEVGDRHLGCCMVLLADPVFDQRRVRGCCGQLAGTPGACPVPGASDWGVHPLSSSNSMLIVLISASLKIVTSVIPADAGIRRLV